jgi:hypothetical protein
MKRAHTARYEKPVSLHPLSFEQAVDAALGSSPPPKKKRKRAKAWPRAVVKYRSQRDTKP